MREHKYRAKRLDGQWVEGYYFAKPILHLHFILEGENQWMIDPDTLCRNISYKDSNKNEIYQNDIVRFYLGKEKLCDFLVWWNNEMQCMSAVDLKWIKFNGFDYFNSNNPRFRYEDFCFMLQDPWCHYNKIKVIGNIFDSPELLEEY